MSCALEVGRTNQVCSNCEAFVSWNVLFLLSCLPSLSFLYIYLSNFFRVLIIILIAGPCWGDKHIHPGFCWMRCGDGRRQKPWPSDTCRDLSCFWACHNDHDLCSWPHFRRPYESCCYYCLCNRKTLPLESGRSSIFFCECCSLSVSTYLQGFLNWSWPLMVQRWNNITAPSLSHQILFPEEPSFINVPPGT